MGHLQVSRLGVGTAYMVPLQTWSLAIPPTLFLVTPKTYQPKHMPTPLHRLLVVPSLFLANIHTLVDAHMGSCPNTDPSWARVKNWCLCL